MIYKLFLKRVFDFIASAVLLIIFSPLILALIIILFIANKGNPFFVQQRPGKNESTFKVIKFKTMNDKRNEKGDLLPDTHRLTKVGRFLRKTSLDELPQLINVLIGQMSFIGPRPLLMRYLPFYTDKERARHKVRPGITGLAQVSGRNLLLWEDRLGKDVEYVENLSFVLDCKILYLTIINVLSQKDIQVDTTKNTGQSDLDIERQFMFKDYGS